MATYYVDSTRPDDTGAGTSEATAKKTIQAGANLMTSNGDQLNIKASGTYSISAAVTFPAALSYTASNRVRGYTTTIGDGGKATVQASAAITMFNPGSNGAVVLLEDLDIDGNSTATVGVNGGQYGGTRNCKVRRCATAINCSSNYKVNSCEVTSFSTVGIAMAATCHVQDCSIHDGTGSGITLVNGASVVGCLIYSNSGASSDGIYNVDGYDVIVRNCVIWNNGRHGVNLLNNYIGIQPGIQNNVIGLNGGYGITFASAPVTTVCPQFRNNAFYSNTSGQISNSVTGENNATLSGNPFTDSASGDFSLNNTAGAGTACRAAGYPGAFPGGTTTGYIDAGAVQHQDAGGGGTTVIVVEDD